MERLSDVERLLLSQIAYEKGIGDWETITSVLVHHPLSSGKAGLTMDLCSTAYMELMEEMGLTSDGIPEDVQKARGPTNLKLARKLYVDRYNRLKNLIIEKQEEFRRLVKEIDDIRSGAWDQKIRSGFSRVRSTANDSPSTKVSETAETSEPLAGPSKRPLLTKPTADTGQEEVLASQEEGNGNGNGRTGISISALAHASEIPQMEDDQSRDEEDSATVEQRLLPEKSTSTPLESRAPQAEGEHIEETELDDLRAGMQDRAPSLPEPPEATASETQSRPTDEANAPPDPSKPTVESPGLDELDPGSTADTVEPKKKLRQPKDLKRKADELRDASSEPQAREKKKPKQSEASNSPAQSAQDVDPAATKKWQKSLLGLLTRITEISTAAPFQKPVRENDAPGYHSIIKRPMDLTTVGKRVRDFTITNSTEFRRDILLICANAVMYNSPESDFAVNARSLAMNSDEMIRIFMATE